MKMPKPVKDKIVLAKVYFEDDAPLTAARLLREAASMMDQIGEAREAALTDAD